MPLNDPAYCRIRAEECERLAASASNAETREIMTYLANRWRALAEQDETPKTRQRPRRWWRFSPRLGVARGCSWRWPSDLSAKVELRDFNPELERIR